MVKAVIQRIEDVIASSRNFTLTLWIVYSGSDIQYDYVVATKDVTIDPSSTKTNIINQLNTAVIEEATRHGFTLSSNDISYFGIEKGA